MQKPASPPRHFLDLNQIDKDSLTAIIRQAHIYKKQLRAPVEALKGKTLALIFEKPSTRTRVSFEVAMLELGGFAISLTGNEMQFGHGESTADTARVLSRYVHAMMIRTYAHDNLLELAKYARVPVINGLTDFSHPCQVMADLITLEERFHRLHNLTVAWCGDGDNNVLTSWMQAAGIFNFEMKIACPRTYAPDPATLAECQKKGRISIFENADDAVRDAHVVVTDTWVSMHHTDADARRDALQPYQIDATRMALAKKEAIFMHCLPAHRGEEVTDAVMDGPQSAVWDEAENRLYAQKAILMWCFGKI